MLDGISKLRDLSGAIFRSNTGYRLTPLEGLALEQRTALGIEADNREVAALLMPDNANRAGIKAVNAETAALVRALQEPGPLPAQLRSAWSAAINRSIASLVLDGLIEVERSGTFLCGVAAQDAILASEEGRIGADGRLSHLSLQAIRHVRSLGMTEAAKVATRLYFYNRLPVTRRWLALWPDAASVLRHLPYNESRLFAGGFARVADNAHRRAWIVWKTRDPRLALSPNDVAFKLYISPMPGEERAAFEGMLNAARDHGCSAFKIGADAYGLLRPDKMILYFTTQEALQAAAAKVARKLEGCRALGVPFSAELAGDGLLSWGLDPPRTDSLGLEYGAESWRLRVANRLAHALVQYGHEMPETEDALRFALTRLRLEGIDTRTWTPLTSPEFAAMQ